MARRSRRNRHGEYGFFVRHVSFLQAVDKGSIEPAVGLHYREAIMSNDTLKTRARNLQRAAQAMFKVPVKLSQAYELLAQEEGFANWDVASNALSPKPSVGAVGSGSPRKPYAEHLVIGGSSQPGGFSIERLAEFQPRLAPILKKIASSPSSMIVISGDGKSGSVELVMELLRVSEPKQSRVSVAHEDEFSHDDAVMKATKEDKKSFKDALLSAMRCVPDQVFFGELRNPESAELAVSTALRGFKVIAKATAEKGQCLAQILADKSKGSKDVCTIVDELSQIDTFHLHIDEDNG